MRVHSQKYNTVKLLYVVNENLIIDIKGSVDCIPSNLCFFYKLALSRYINLYVRKYRSNQVNIYKIVGKPKTCC